MPTRTALLNWNVINRDADFSKYIEAVSEPWVISWFTVSSSSVSVWEAFVKCERTNGDTIYAVVYNNSAQSISGNGDVYIEIPQELIDNGELANEDWSEIAEIKVGTMPSKNAIKLAIINNGVVEDKRNIIKKVWELNALISENISDIIDLDNRVWELEEAEAINHLEDSSFVWELYSLNDLLFKQYTPTLENSTIDCNVGNTNTNAQIHIQRIGAGIADNEIKIKVKKIWSPTTNLIVEVRKGVEVDVSTNEAYWYGDEVIASWSIEYSDITSTYAEKTITLDANFGSTKGELLDVVIYQTNSTVNDTNYYAIACDKTQYSEWLSYVKVNWNTRVRSREIPYCVSEWLSNNILAKKWINADLGIVNTISNTTDTILYTANKNWQYKFKCSLYTSSSNGSQNIKLALNASADSGSVFVQLSNNVIWTKEVEVIFDMKEWDVLHWYTRHGSTWSWNASNMKLYSEKSPQNAIPLKPIEVKNIWEVWYWTSYGIHSGDGIFYWGYMIKKTNGATTWNITLWNAVWFIEVNFNWEIIKIPYYS